MLLRTTTIGLVLMATTVAADASSMCRIHRTHMHKLVEDAVDARMAGKHAPGVEAYVKTFSRTEDQRAPNPEPCQVGDTVYVNNRFRDQNDANKLAAMICDARYPISKTQFTNMFKEVEHGFTCIWRGTPAAATPPAQPAS